jgi:glycosyltransferase involved in cell wall biosynthesis
MNNPLISVIIPTYNNAETILIAIESILNQTYQNIEIIVIDDFSIDNTFEIVSSVSKKNNSVYIYKSDFDDLNKFDPVLNRNINAGYSARNTGFKYVKGEYITFQDADDASLLNRIELQYKLLKQYDALHICTSCQEFDKNLVGSTLDVKDYLNNIDNITINSKELYKMSQRSKGFIAKISTTLNSITPFHIKRMRIINKLFFGTLESYPGAGNSPLFKREIINKVQFRNLKNRVWPSFMGRGADKDFNFQVAETFKNSMVFKLPLYLWRTKK